MPWILETMPKITKVWLNCNLSCLTLSKSQAFFSGGWTYKDGTWRITTNRLLQCTTVEQTLFVKVVHQHTIELLVWTEHRESRFRLCAVKLLQNNNKKKETSAIVWPKIQTLEKLPSSCSSGSWFWGSQLENCFLLQSLMVLRAYLIKRVEICEPNKEDRGQLHGSNNS